MIEKEEKVIDEEILAGEKLDKIDQRLDNLERTLSLLARRLPGSTGAEAKESQESDEPPL